MSQDGDDDRDGDGGVGRHDDDETISRIRWWSDVSRGRVTIQLLNKSGHSASSVAELPLRISPISWETFGSYMNSHG